MRPVNDPPDLVFDPDIIDIDYNDPTPVSLWDAVQDVDTDPADMDYDIDCDDSILSHEFDDDTGILTITANKNADTQTSCTVTITDVDGSEASATLTINIHFVVGIDDRISSAVPTEYGITQNYPNPFNPETTIDYQLPNSGQVSLIVYNMLGQKMRTLVSEDKVAGEYRVVWDGRDDLGNPVATGIYLYMIQAGEYTRTMKMIYMK